MMMGRTGTTLILALPLILLLLPLALPAPLAAQQEPSNTPWGATPPSPASPLPASVRASGQGWAGQPPPPGAPQTWMGSGSSLPLTEYITRTEGGTRWDGESIATPPPDGWSNTHISCTIANLHYDYTPPPDTYIPYSSFEENPLSAWSFTETYKGPTIANSLAEWNSGEEALAYSFENQVPWPQLAVSDRAEGYWAATTQPLDNQQVESATLTATGRVIADRASQQLPITDIQIELYSGDTLIDSQSWDSITQSGATYPFTLAGPVSMGAGDATTVKLKAGATTWDSWNVPGSRIIFLWDEVQLNVHYYGEVAPQSINMKLDIYALEDTGPNSGQVEFPTSETEWTFTILPPAGTNGYTVCFDAAWRVTATRQSSVTPTFTATLDGRTDWTVAVTATPPAGWSYDHYDIKGIPSDWSYDGCTPSGAGSYDAGTATITGTQTGSYTFHHPNSLLTVTPQLRAANADTIIRSSNTWFMRGESFAVKATTSTEGTAGLTLYWPNGDEWKSCGGQATSGCECSWRRDAAEAYLVFPADGPFGSFTFTVTFISEDGLHAGYRSASPRVAGYYITSITATENPDGSVKVNGTYGAEAVDAGKATLYVASIREVAPAYDGIIYERIGETSLYLTSWYQSDALLTPDTHDPFSFSFTIKNTGASQFYGTVRLRLVSIKGGNHCIFSREETVTIGSGGSQTFIWDDNILSYWNTLPRRGVFQLLLEVSGGQSGQLPIHEAVPGCYVMVTDGTDIDGRIVTLLTASHGAGLYSATFTRSQLPVPAECFFIAAFEDTHHITSECQPPDTKFQTSLNLKLFTHLSDPSSQGRYGETATISATLTEEAAQNVEHDCSSNLFTVRFWADWGAGSGYELVGTDTIHMGETAATTLTLNHIPGEYTVKVNVTGDNEHKSTETVGTLTITKIPTSIDELLKENLVLGEEATFTAHLIDDGASPVEGCTVTFWVSPDNVTWGSPIGSAATNSSGWASVTWQVEWVGKVYLKAHFAGNTYYAASNTKYGYGDSDPAPTSLTLTLSPSTQYYGQNVTLVACLVNGSGYPLQGMLVEFYIFDGGWQPIGSSTTNASGYAILVWTVNRPAGDWTLNATFPGTSQYASSSDTENLTVREHTSFLSFGAYPTQTQYTHNTTLKAQLRGEATGVLEGRNISFWILLDGGWVLIGWNLTDSQGWAMVAYNCSLHPDTYSIRAVFDGEELYDGYQKTSNLTVTKEETSMAYFSYMAVRWGDTVTFYVRLVDSQGHGLAGRSVDIILVTDGLIHVREWWGRVTNATGWACATWVVDLDPVRTDLLLEASWNGDEYYEWCGANTGHEVDVLRELSQLTGWVNVTIQYTDTLVFTVTLRDDEGNPLPGETVEFRYQSPNWRLLGTNTTGPDGVATLKWTATLNPGSYPIKVVFAETGYYLSCESGVKTLTVEKEATILLLNVDNPTVLVSTFYDPTMFAFTVTMVDDDGQVVEGWVNLTIGGANMAGYCSAGSPAIFNHHPTEVGVYQVTAWFDGNTYYTQDSDQITVEATRRSITYQASLPDTMTATQDASFLIFNLYDADFIGWYNGTSYYRDFPINGTIDIFWTINPGYGEPRTHAGQWDIWFGSGTATWHLPWDLDNDHRLTGDDFACYIILSLNCGDNYENDTIYMAVDVLQLLYVNISMTTLTYSDSASLNMSIYPRHDPSYTVGLSLPLTIHVSGDNQTWTTIGTLTADAQGLASLSWTPGWAGLTYFKLEVAESDLYAACTSYGYGVAAREVTEVSLLSALNFTYSDQGVMVGRLVTDDGEPVAGHTLYLEVLDGAWVSIGSGVTNESGYVHILWVPTLPAGTYQVRLLAPLTGSTLYLPSNATGQLVISRELLLLALDISTAHLGYITATITDDDGAPVGGLTVKFYVDGEFWGTDTTNSEGVARLDTQLKTGQTVRAVVEENSYYISVQAEEQIPPPPLTPPNPTLLLLAVGAVAALISLLALARKLWRRRPATPPNPQDLNLRRALEEERRRIPERIRQQSRRQLAELNRLAQNTTPHQPPTPPEQLAPPTPPSNPSPNSCLLLRSPRPSDRETHSRSGGVGWPGRRQPPRPSNCSP